MRLNKKYIYISLIVLFACCALFVLVNTAPNSADPRENFQYWLKRFTKEVPLGSSKEQILLWAKEHSIDYEDQTRDPQSRSLFLFVKGDYGDCDKPVIHLEMKDNKSVGQKTSFAMAPDYIK